MSLLIQISTPLRKSSNLKLVSYPQPAKQTWWCSQSNHPTTKKRQKTNYNTKTNQEVTYTTTDHYHAKQKNRKEFDRCSFI
jgi:hypothetical protein